MPSFLIYGASGYTGKLIAHAARGAGLTPVLGGRSAAKLRQLAADLQLEHRVFSLEDAEGIDQGLHDVQLVLNAAGPFSSTAERLVDACLRVGAHYLDISGEVQPIQAAARRSQAARRRGIMVMPAVGFDVVPSDCLAAHVARLTAHPARLAIGVSGLDLLSRGSALTIVEQLADPIWVRRRGELSQVPPASLERSFDFGKGPTPAIAVSWGDVASAYYSTGIPDVTVYFEATPPVRLHTKMVGAMAGVVPLGPWQEWLKTTTRFLPEGPTSNDRTRHSAVIVAEVEGSGGHVVRSRLRTPEAYSMTAWTSTAIVSRILDGDWEAGFQTPSRVFGADFVLSAPSVSREDL